jgi:hypothetical protein
MKFYKSRIAIASLLMCIGACRLLMALFDTRPTPWPTIVIASGYLIIGVVNLILLKLKAKKRLMTSTT